MGYTTITNPITKPKKQLKVVNPRLVSRHNPRGCRRLVDFYDEFERDFNYPWSECELEPNDLVLCDACSKYCKFKDIIPHVLKKSHRSQF